MDITPRPISTRNQKSHRRWRMRRDAKAAGLPPPSEADYEAAGCAAVPKDIAQARVASAMKAREEWIKAKRVCGTCHILLDEMRAPLPEADPGWRCKLSRCKGPLTAADIAAREHISTDSLNQDFQGAGT
jgi:hypothetical protein